MHVGLDLENQYQIRLGSKSSLRQSQIAYLKFIGNVYKQKNMKVNHTMKTTNVLFTTICSTFLT